MAKEEMEEIVEGRDSSKSKNLAKENIPHHSMTETQKPTGLEDHALLPPPPSPRRSQRLLCKQKELTPMAMAAMETPLDISIPKSWQQAMASPEQEYWREAAEKEYKGILKNDTYDLIPLADLPPSANILGNMWVFRLKPGNLFRARMVVRGDWQIEGVDFFEVFAPTAKLQTFRTLLHLGGHYDLEMEQLDFVTAFMNGDLEEDVFMRQPQGFVNKDHPTHVCKLKKALNGIRQAPRQWYAKLKEALEELGFNENPSEPTLFQSITSTTKMFVLVFVDDLLVAATTTFKN